MPWLDGSSWIPVAIFLACYAGVAVGGVPGLALDRTGIALLGAIAMVACGVLPLETALRQIDAPTLLLLYALMVVSAQFRVGGFYTWAALALNRFIRRPRLFLWLVMSVTAALSALLVNDVICLAFTPVLAVSLLRAGWNPVPFLLGLAVASNIGSATTMIGNPQNMLIGQMGQLRFGAFLGWCLAPSLVSLAGAYGLIVWRYRRGFAAVPEAGRDPAADWPPFNRHQSLKGLLATGALVALFFTALPRELTALAIAGMLLCSRRMRTRDMLELVDWHLITLFCGLFIVIGGLQTTGLPERLVAVWEARGLNLQQPYLLTGVAVLLSNLVSNVPAVMLLIQFLDPAQPTQWYVLALASTYAGNLITIGSIANLITIEQARRYGIRIGFREHARVGLPVTFFSLLVVAVWVWATSR